MEFRVPGWKNQHQNLKSLGLEVSGSKTQFPNRFNNLGINGETGL
jgi:hypothetical protein